MKSFSVVSVVFAAGGVAQRACAQTNTDARGRARCRCRTASSRRCSTTSTCRSSATIRKFRSYNLNADYGGYDPTFNFSGQHDYNDSGGTFQNGQHIAGSEYNEDSFSSSFNGTLPWGMIYDLGGNVSSTKGDNSPCTNGFCNCRSKIPPARSARSRSRSRC